MPEPPELPAAPKLRLPNPRAWFDARPKLRKHPNARRHQLKLAIPAALMMLLVQGLILQQYLRSPLPPVVLVLPDQEIELNLFPDQMPPPLLPPPPPPPPRPTSAAATAARPAANQAQARPANANANPAAASQASQASATATVSASSESTPKSVQIPLQPSASRPIPQPMLDVTPSKSEASARLSLPSAAEQAPLLAQTIEPAEEKGVLDASNEDQNAQLQPMRAVDTIDRQVQKAELDLRVEPRREATYEIAAAPTPAMPLQLRPEQSTPLRVAPTLAVNTKPALVQPEITLPQTAEAPLQRPVETALNSKPELRIDRPNSRPNINVELNIPTSAEPVLGPAPKANIEKIDAASLRAATNAQDRAQAQAQARANLAPAIAANVPEASPSPRPASNQPVAPGAAPPASNASSASNANVPANPFGAKVGSAEAGQNVDLQGAAGAAARAIADGSGNGNGNDRLGTARGFKEFHNPFADDAPNPLRGLRQREPQLFLDISKYLVSKLGPAALGFAVKANEEVDDFTAVDAGPLIERWLEQHHSELKADCVRSSDMPEHVRALLCEK
jgi:hypothetical protein